MISGVPLQPFHGRHTTEIPGRGRRHCTWQAMSAAAKSWVYKTVLRAIEVIV
jgi:hypothetical protein